MYIKKENNLNHTPCWGKGCSSDVAHASDGLRCSLMALLGYFPNESYKQSCDMAWALDEGAMRLSNQIVLGERSCKYKDNSSI